MSAGIILIDDRAGSRDLISHPPLSTSASLCRLDSADVCIPGHGPSGPILIGVEVKSLSDLVASMMNGRLTSQVRRMIPEYDIRYVLFYGVCRCGEDGSLETLRVRKKRGRGKPEIEWYPVISGPYGCLQFESAIMALEDIGVRVRHGAFLVKDEAIAQCASWIGHLAHRYSKRWDEHRSLLKLDNSRRATHGKMVRDSQITLLPVMSDDMEKRVRVAERLPGGVGYKRGVAAAKHFPSILDMVIATGAEWAEVPGVRIGKVIGESVERSVRDGSGVPVGVNLRDILANVIGFHKEYQKATGGKSRGKKATAGRTAGRRKR